MNTLTIPTLKTMATPITPTRDAPTIHKTAFRVVVVPSGPKRGVWLQPDTYSQTDLERVKGAARLLTYSQDAQSYLQRPPGHVWERLSLLVAEPREWMTLMFLVAAEMATIVTILSHPNHDIPAVPVAHDHD